MKRSFFFPFLVHDRKENESKKDKEYNGIDLRWSFAKDDYYIR
jgi:hypothetical protein